MAISAIKIMPIARNIINGLGQEGRIVYSTATNGARAGTMFDAFCKTMQRNKIAQRAATESVKITEESAKQLEAKANEILKNSGANGIVTYRIKSIDSGASKIQKEFKGFAKKGYDSSREQIHEIILGNGPRELICDAYGMRFATNDTAKIYNEMLKQHNQNFQFTCFEDYFGKGLKPYAGESIVNKFRNLTYKNSYGEMRNTIGVTAEKSSGYTRTNSNALINGVKTEIQVGGEHTIKWGDAEHLLYDVRQGKLMDLSHVKKEYINLAKQIENEYQKLISNPKLNKIYTENYLNKIWGTLIDAETKGLANPIYPPLPKGISPLLSAETIMKLV